MVLNERDVELCRNNFECLQVVDLVTRGAFQCCLCELTVAYVEELALAHDVLENFWAVLFDLADHDRLELEVRSLVLEYVVALGPFWHKTG